MMDIQNAIEKLSSAANSIASKNWNYTPYVRAVLSHIAELQQRADNAEAQLAELAKQEPDYTRYDCGACGHETFTGNYRNICPVCNHRPMKETGLFTHPSPPAPVKLPKFERLDGNGYGYYFDMDDIFVALESAGIKYETTGGSVEE